MTSGAPQDDGGSARSVPRHVAVIMDGNGRWAQARFLPRAAGHRAGVSALRTTVQECQQHGCEVLTVFAFSSENWARPATEVGFLMQLLLESLEREIDALSRNGVRVRFIGNRDVLPEQLSQRMAAAEQRTAANAGLQFVIAIGYGGRWDIVAAARRLARGVQAGEFAPESIDDAKFAAALDLAGLPDPDLFIRTGGERRISNFLLYNLAYTELWFTDVLWPDFGKEDLASAFADFARRNRRYGRIDAPQDAGPC